ncbi:MAG: tetratricopeptide repeat protein, partial [Terriglobales bacterium]
PKKAAIFCMRADLKSESGDKSGSLNDYNECILLNPANAAGLKHRAAIHYSLGQFQFAIDDYSKALRYSPRDWTLFGGRGLALLSLQKRDSAMSDFRRVIASAPKEVGPYEQIAHIYFARFNNAHPLTDKEVSDLNNIVASAGDLGSRDHIVYYFRGIFGRYRWPVSQDPIADYSTAIRLKPDFWPAYLERGRDMCDKADLKARSDLPISNVAKADIERDRRLVASLRRRGIIDLTVVLAHWPNNADAYYLRGQCRKSAGDAGGQADIESAKKLDPAYARDFWSDFRAKCGKDSKCKKAWDQLEAEINKKK